MLPAQPQGPLDPGPPPQALLDAVRDFFAHTLPHDKIRDAWQTSHAQAIQAGRYGEDLLVQDSINYLLDTASLPTPSPPPTPPDRDSPIFLATPSVPRPSLDRNHTGPSRILVDTPGSVGPSDSKTKKRVVDVDWTDEHQIPAAQSGSGGPKRHRHAPDPQADIPAASSSAVLEPKPELTGPEIAARIHEIIPDVAEEFAINLYNSQPDTMTCARERIQHVIDHLIERPGYPKRAATPVDVPASGSGPVEEPEDKMKVYERGLARWTSANRPDPDPRLVPAAVGILAQAFPRVGLPYLRYALTHKRHLALAWIFIEEQLATPDARPVPLNKTTRPRARVPSLEVGGEMQQEFEWLKVRQANLVEIRAEEEQEKELQTLEELEGLLLECQCCFDTFRFVKMIQCPEGHLFCADCVKRNAEVQVGLNKAEIRCMDSSDCPFAFPKAELLKALNDQVMARLEQIALEDSLEQANIEGLEKCPFCVWAVIIENAEERVFRCGNQKCSKESCRKCKKPSHIPKTCDEVLEEESKSNSMHVVAEAMTQALIRKCPKCRKAFVKESGCNKMRCAHCATLSCYVCQEIVTGYEHFSNAGSNLKGKDPDPKAKCPLWDDTNQRHAQDVESALKVANKKLEQSGSTTEGNAPLTAKDIAALKADPVPPAARAVYPPGYPPGVQNYLDHQALGRMHVIPVPVIGVRNLEAEQAAIDQRRLLEHAQRAQNRARRMAAYQEAAQAGAVLGRVRGGGGVERDEEVARARRAQAGAVRMLQGPKARN